MDDVNFDFKRTADDVRDAASISGQPSEDTSKPVYNLLRSEDGRLFRGTLAQYTIKQVIVAGGTIEVIPRPQPLKPAYAELPPNVPPIGEKLERVAVRQGGAAVIIVDKMTGSTRDGWRVAIFSLNSDGTFSERDQKPEPKSALKCEAVKGPVSLDAKCEICADRGPQLAIRALLGATVQSSPMPR